ncbi:hypothetical protein CPB85DRAFT_598342 [Mucidula mucida]|nr:hypothetical protein CPB85DRAFT_598342 [Mucidula mucida]
MSDEVQTCTHAPDATEETSDEEEDSEEDIDIYDPGESNPYTHEYIFKHEPFLYIPDAYYPDDGFSPPCLVFGIGLWCHEAVAYAEEHGLIVRSEPEYSATDLLFGYLDMAVHFSELYGRRIEISTAFSNKCDIVFALFDNYSRPDDTETQDVIKDILGKLVKLFPAAGERLGYFFSSLNERMYPEGYSRLMYQKE